MALYNFITIIITVEINTINKVETNAYLFHEYQLLAMSYTSFYQYQMTMKWRKINLFSDIASTLQQTTAFYHLFQECDVYTTWGI